MTLERKREMAHMCAELTDGLPSKIKRIGEALIQAMVRANCPSCQLDCDIAVGRIHGILDVLTIMGVPHKVIRRGKYGDYMAVEIAGETFPVKTCDTD